MTEIRNELLDEFLKDSQNPADLVGKNGLLKSLAKRLLEQATNAGLDHPLDYKKNTPPCQRANSRNGYGKKTVLTRGESIAARQETGPVKQALLPQSS